MCGEEGGEFLKRLGGSESEVGYPPEVFAKSPGLTTAERRVSTRRDAVEDGEGVTVVVVVEERERERRAGRDMKKKNVAPGVVAAVLCCRECRRAEGNDLGCSRSGWRHCGARGFVYRGDSGDFSGVLCGAGGSCPPRPRRWSAEAS